MTTTPTYAYPFDPTGTQPSNLIQGERQTISAPNWTDFYFIIPFAAPYFRESLQIIHHPSGKILSEGVDYSCTHRFHDASLACGKPIYGSITFFDKTLVGVVELQYQTIGGAWTIDTNTLLQILADTQLNPRITTWEQVVNLPFEFPVIDHQWDLVDMVGASEIVTALGDIKDAILASGSGGLADHLADYNNPHRVTATQVGLGNVPNYSAADLPTAVAGTDNASFMTPLRTAQAINTQALTPLNNHISDYNNPHQVTAAQVGLDKIQNYSISDQASAQAGTSNILYMTPLRTAQAINTLAVTPLNAHIARTDNPHSVTKAQVGLGSVQNYGIATAVDARAGTSNILYMTPAMVAEAIAAQSGGDLTSHINNYNNPHQVTAAQVGLGNVQDYSIATQALAEAGTDNASYMTPLAVAQAISAQVGLSLTNHVNSVDNPHQVTATQVGLGNVQNLPLATQAQAEAGTSDLTYMTPLKTAQAIDLQALTPLNAHIARTDNPHSVTAAQVGLDQVANYPVATQAQAEAGTDDESYMTPLKVAQAVAVLAGTGSSAALDAHLADFNNPHQVTAAQVGAYSIAQTDSLLSTKLGSGDVATDSNALEGKDLKQVIALNSVNGIPGNLLFGASGLTLDYEQLYYDTGELVEFATVIENTSDEAAAQAIVETMQGDYRNMIPTSAFNAFNRNFAPAELSGWSWNVATGGVEYTPASTGLSGLRSAARFTDYTFEVELSSTDTADNALGVCAAFIHRDQKDHGIYVLRTPGGLVLQSQAASLPGGDIYKLFSVGYNLLQNDAVDLGSTNTGLVWGDGVADADRGTAGAYVSDGTHGWSVNGTVRIRVTRAGNTLTIETTQFAGTDYAAGASVTVDLTSDPNLQPLLAATSYGLVSYSQAAGVFKVLARPGSYHPYVLLQLDGNNEDISTYHWHDGAAWQSTDITQPNKFMKPGRLYYSDMNARLFFARRDGTLVQLNIEAYTPTDQTVLTV